VQLGHLRVEQRRLLRILKLCPQPFLRASSDLISAFTLVHRDLIVQRVGSAKRDFLSFPASVKDDMCNALGIAQFGGTAPTAKPWKGLGPGVLEIVESHVGNAYRAVYTVRFEKALYVLHAFQKKSPSGIRTAKRDVDLVAERLKTAARDYKEHYGKPKR
jgi:phage-related protein